ncbi:DUF397 domain-containing protein [Streptomyces sp. A3M-1-3]|uniref:DUF397 domain-containing protein n=1 Tax=Streptomyces sp. A3M-1-3 TaxID=2962044 RepID=UPI0020B8A028|nr:DUF397 domain-containing protein [Streptomyces sp. A3M-1-3]MCP3819961.1 DUF397 domain-containing protein [Streptomyces sp. A3M-1-3]
MPNHDWQQSSYCAEGNACLNIATAPDGTIKLRESNNPEVIVTTPTTLRIFIRGIKASNIKCATNPVAA